MSIMIYGWKLTHWKWLSIMSIGKCYFKSLDTAMTSQKWGGPNTPSVGKNGKNTNLDFSAFGETVKRFNHFRKGWVTPRKLYIHLLCNTGVVLPDVNLNEGKPKFRRAFPKCELSCFYELGDAYKELCSWGFHLVWILWWTARLVL